MVRVKTRQYIIESVVFVEDIDNDLMTFAKSDQYIYVRESGEETPSSITFHWIADDSLIGGRLF